LFKKNLKNIICTTFSNTTKLVSTQTKNAFYVEKKKKRKAFEVYASEYTNLGIVYCLKVVFIENKLFFYI
jgi:hypothetical protein